jgi:sporulation protein YlmC with PRC-barrel domain
MIKLTDIISKPVICVSSASTLGTIENAVFDKKLSKVSFLCVFDEELGEKKYIRASSIINTANNAVTVKSGMYCQNEIKPNSPLKARIYDCEGNAEGYISDIVLDEELKVLKILTSDRTAIKPENILSFSPAGAVFYKEGQKPLYVNRIKNKSVKKSAARTEIHAEQTEKEEKQKNALSDESEQNKSETENTPAKENSEKEQKNLKNPPSEENNTHKEDITQKSESDENKPKSNENPENIIAENNPPPDIPACQTAAGNFLSAVPIRFINIVPPYNYLIGRKITSDIYDENRKVIAGKDSVITMNTVDICRRHNRLMTLAKNSKKIR